MPYFRTVGTVPHKRHTRFRQPGGELYYEEMIGEEGFSSTFSLLYHRAVPAAFSGSADWQLPDQATTPNHPVRLLHLKLHDLRHDGGRAPDAVRDRRLVLGNDDLRISYVAATEASPLYRNAIGDECVYIESGQAAVESVFGSIDAGEGDFVVIPRGTIHRWLPRAGGAGPLRAYCVEASSHIVPPARYLSRYGQLTEFAPYSERDLYGPAEPLIREGRDVPVYTKHRGPGPAGIAGSVVYAARHPFDVDGWAGCLYPFRFNVADFEPVIGRVHQPPPVHQVFEGQNFVICAFVPRMADYHPDGIPVPYYHVNADSDEVMFYCGGDYAARRGSGIGLGSVSVHPAGLSHGPMPGVMEKALGTTFHQELAIMIDTFRPLHLGEAGRSCADDGYHTSAGRALDALDPPVRGDQCRRPLGDPTSADRRLTLLGGRALLGTVTGGSGGSRCESGAVPPLSPGSDPRQQARRMRREAEPPSRREGRGEAPIREPGDSGRPFLGTGARTPEEERALMPEPTFP